MSETITVLFAAFGGGALGAVLQPVVSYAMGLLTAEHSKRDQRRRNLRAMLNAWTAYGTTMVNSGRMLKFRMDAGQPPTAQEKQAILDTSHLSREPWLPERIHDSPLRASAEEYFDKLAQLTALLYTSWDDNKRGELSERVTELGVAITARMDALNWPEVE